MNFHILTLFPEMVMQGLNTSIIGRACEKGLLSIEAVNIRDYTTDKHKKVDDYPYGGGAGMLMQAQPVYDAYLHVVDHCLWNCRWPKSFSSLSSKIKLTNLFKTIPNSFLVSFEGKAAHS